MENWLQAAGAFIAFVTALDVFLTVLYARSGAGILTPYLSGGIWRGFRTVGKALPSGGGTLMSFAGPVILSATVFTWLGLLVLGFALIVWPALASDIQASSGPTPADLTAALYYSGYTLSTLGYGDLLPKNGEYRLLTVLIAFTGFSVLTLSLTYIISVYGALVERNTLALNLHHATAESGDPAELLARLGAGGKFSSSAISQVDALAAGMLRMLQTHHAYPVLHYFRNPGTEYAMARMMLLVLDMASLARTALERQGNEAFVSSAAFATLWEAACGWWIRLGGTSYPRAPSSVSQQWKRRASSSSAGVDLSRSHRTDWRRRA